MNKRIHCDMCGIAIPHGKKVWAYGSMRCCDGKCLVAVMHEKLPEKPRREKSDWTAARLKHLEEERTMVE
ncbi:hypothetical protein [Sporosarcina sp. FSL K6-3457]|uniref:hypothetical protein n=1 Tax=Sporosarcina sp. FSL K6-3457 TaxID=2978204 RepID=UPI0030FA4551